MHDLAQLNIARPVEPLTSPRLKGFVDLLDPVNAAADAAPGFVWRLQTEDGDATAIRGFGDDALIVNLSTWTSLEALGVFVYGALHATVLRRRREWFERMREPFTVLWWVPSGHRPTVGEAEERLALVAAEGPGPRAFTFRRPFPAPGSTSAPPTDATWSCGV